MATQYPECHFTAVEVIPGSLQALPSLPNISGQTCMQKLNVF
jgi:hypothetical protein